MLIYRKKTHLVEAILYMFKTEKIDYIEHDNLEYFNDSINKIVFIDDNNEISKELSDINVPIIIVCNEKRKVETSTTINYLLTNLIEDSNEYSDTQKEFLFKKGIYSILNKKILDFINHDDNINGLCIDTTSCITKENDWIFKFDSIAESYNWLSGKNKQNRANLVKEINIYNEKKIFNDSSKEINYLVNKIMLLKEGAKLIDIFICTTEEFQKLKNNYFFKTLLNNISNTYSIFYINKNKLLDEQELLKELNDGIIIYKDCVYRDTYNDEYSLGYVDCNLDSIKTYNDYFEILLNNYAEKVNKEGEADGI